MQTTPDTGDIVVSLGFDRTETDQVARMFWQAFHGKLRLMLAPDRRAIAFLISALNPNFALAARTSAGRLMGIAGFKTEMGGLVGGGLRDLAAVYGWPGALWRGWLLSLLERDVERGVLLMDGIFVTEDARNKGVGTALLSAIKAHARKAGAHSVRLDVIDSNPRAKALYAREGFQPIREEHLGALRHIFGFRSATQMVWAVEGE